MTVKHMRALQDGMVNGSLMDFFGCVKNLILKEENILKLSLIHI